jgi:hypothetical protein
MNIPISPRPVGGRRPGSVPAGLVALAAAAGLLVISPPARAQEVVVVNQEGGGGAYRGPNWMVLSTGLVIFSGTYTASIVVGATSSHAGDQSLFVPFAGPWMDLGNRCPGRCDNDVGNKVLLGFDGVFQGLGALTVLSSFFLPSRRGRGLASERSGPTLRVLPASVGRGAPGLTAIGTF